MPPMPDDAWSPRSCPSCGAVVTQPPERISHACSYCASALVEVDVARPHIDRVAPFRLAATAAEDRLRQHVAARWWAPESLRRAAKTGRLDARLVEGVLVPFYTYDATCRSRYETKVGLYWYETKTVRKKGKKGEKDETEQKVERHTEWFPLRGTAVQQLRDHLVSASVGLDAKEVAGLRPFDLGRARAFDPRLLAGWSAEIPSRGRSQTDRDALQQIRSQEIRRISRQHLPGDTHRSTRVSCQVELAETELVLLPVWVAALRHGDTIHRLLVNGQTGRCHGSAPVSTTKIVVAVLLAAVMAALIAWRMSA